jgi:uncharacterized protein
MACRRRWLPVALLLACTLLPVPAAVPASDQEAWRSALLADRAAKDREFAADPTSPMAGTARLTVPAGATAFLVYTPLAVVVHKRESAGPGFAVGHDDHGWSVRTHHPGTAARNREALLSGATLGDGQQLRLERFTLRVFPGADALTVQVFDPQRPELLAFRGLKYYPPNFALRVTARVERLPVADPVRVPTSRQLEKKFFRTARLHFVLEGREQVLTALQSALSGEGAAEYFIPFQDATSGGETYAVGRFLDVPVPAGDELVLDFNRCYNPLCNYSPAYNCPIPPRENWLEVAIPAGEKTYPHPE